VSLEEHLLSQLKEGAVLGDVYNSIVSKVKADRPDLVDRMTKTLGFSMGIEFRDASITISAGNTTVVKKDMVFNVNMGFTGLTNKDASDAKGKDVALFIGDTVVVSGEGPATVITTSKKKIKNIAIFLKDADSEEEEKENKKSVLPDPETFGRGKRTAILDQKLRQDPTAEEKRKLHQKQLMLKMNAEALRRIKEGGSSEEKVKLRKAPISYKSPGQLPREREVKELKIYVDKKYETVILPIFGVPVPFHIATVKNISQSVEGDYTYLRINFFHPGASIGKDSGMGFAINPESTFLKEL
jgi:nucleosome binding factor SPN SPT16 subunit